MYFWRLYMIISLRLPDEDATLFRKYAELNNMNLSEMIRQTVLKRIEEDFDLETYRKALEECLDNLETFSLDKEIELAAEDLRLACRAIGKITGNVEVDEILDKIFGSFCIGK